MDFHMIYRRNLNSKKLSFFDVALNENFSGGGYKKEGEAQINTK
jgi:hypothetical protein